MTKGRKKNCGCSMKGGKSPYPISSAVAAEYTPRMKIVNIDGVPRAVTYDAAGTSTSGNSAQMNYMIKTPMVSGGAKTKRKTMKKKILSKKGGKYWTHTGRSSKINRNVNYNKFKVKEINGKTYLIDNMGRMNMLPEKINNTSKINSVAAKLNENNENYNELLKELENLMKENKKGGRKKTKKTKKQVKRKIHKGPRGGKYYMSKGKKVYV